MPLTDFQQTLRLVALVIQCLAVAAYPPSLNTLHSRSSAKALLIFSYLAKLEHFFWQIIARWIPRNICHDKCFSALINCVSQETARIHGQEYHYLLEVFIPATVP